MYLLLPSLIVTYIYNQQLDTDVQLPFETDKSTYSKAVKPMQSIMTYEQLTII